MGQANSSLLSKDEDVLQLVCDINNKCEKKLIDPDIKIIFAITETETTLFSFWKQQTYVCCYSIVKDTTYVKKYNVFEFIRFHHSLSQLLDAIDVSSNLHLWLNKNLSSIFQERCSSVEGNCIICLEDIPNNVLPCTHAYCNKCIQTFVKFQKNPKCPLCRYELSANTDGDAWEITEPPVRELISKYLVDNSLLHNN